MIFFYKIKYLWNAIKWKLFLTKYKPYKFKNEYNVEYLLDDGTRFTVIFSKYFSGASIFLYKEKKYLDFVSLKQLKKYIISNGMFNKRLKKVG